MGQAGGRPSNWLRAAARVYSERGGALRNLGGLILSFFSREAAPQGAAAFPCKRFEFSCGAIPHALRKNSARYLVSSRHARLKAEKLRRHGVPRILAHPAAIGLVRVTDALTFLTNCAAGRLGAKLGGWKRMIAGRITFLGGGAARPGRHGMHTEPWVRNSRHLTSDNPER